MTTEHVFLEGCGREKEYWGGVLNADGVDLTFKANLRSLNFILY